MTGDTKKAGKHDTARGAAGLGRRHRRGTRRFLGAGVAPAAAQMAQGHREVRPGTPPLQGLRVIERSAVLSGRLAGVLLADQGAEVFVEGGSADPTPGGLDDTFFDRGKVAVTLGRYRRCLLSGHHRRGRRRAVRARAASDSGADHDGPARRRCLRRPAARLLGGSDQRDLRLLHEHERLRADPEPAGDLHADLAALRRLRRECRGRGCRGAGRPAAHGSRGWS